MARYPALEIDAAEDQWQLGGKLHALLNGEAVTELVEHLAKHAERFGLIDKTCLFAKFLQPFLGLLYGVSDRWRYRHCSCFLRYTTSTDAPHSNGRGVHCIELCQASWREITGAADGIS